MNNNYTLKNKIQSTEYKQSQKTKVKNAINSLEIRTLEFAKIIIKLSERLPRTMVNNELIKQIIRSGTSVGANYREANESLGKKDFVFRLKITRKEAKETSYWLELIRESNQNFTNDIAAIFQESQELRNIFTSILNKFK